MLIIVSFNIFSNIYEQCNLESKIQEYKNYFVIQIPKQCVGLFCQLPKYIEGQKKNIYLEQRSLLRGFLYARFTNTGFKVFRSVLLKDAFLVAAQGTTYPPQILQTFP